MTLCVVVFIWISLMVTVMVTGDTLPSGSRGSPKQVTILLSEGVIGPFIVHFFFVKEDFTERRTLIGSVNLLWLW